MAFLFCYQGSRRKAVAGPGSTLDYVGQFPVITTNQSTYYQSDIYTLGG